MKQHVVSAFTPTLNLWLFIFFLFCKGSFCSDPNYETCVPNRCGGNGLNISYPFHIRGLQNSSCGYPGLELQCNNNDSSVLLRLSGNDYLVRDIDYENRSVRLLNVPTSTCPTLRNLTIDPNYFLIDNVSISKVVFLMNCSNQLPKNLTRYRIGSCDPATQLVMLGNDSNLGIGKEFCTRHVVAVVLVELQGGEGSEVVDGGNYAEVMRRGFTMRWLPSVAGYCGICGQTGGRCGFHRANFQFLCFCPDRPHRVRCVIETTREGPLGTHKKGTKRRVFIVASISAGVVTTLVVIVLCFLWRLKRRRKTKNHVNVETFLKNHEFLAPKRYSYRQVKNMTNSFEIKLGQGGFGSVYRGVLRNGKLVAVKILSELKGNGEDFINEVASVGRTSHVNIVSLVGFCFEGSQRALIYEFMPNGSLEKFIYEQVSSSNSQLGWEKLHQIAVGIARGLEYLHSGCNTRILHFDIKPHNILLDGNLCPKISDFGLAKLFTDEKSKISLSHMRGTPGYIAPELFSRNFGQVSHKSDVYSYGMMILEMVGGRKNIEVEVDHTSEIYFPHWIYKKVESHEEKLELHGIVSDKENEMARKMIIVGLWCIQTNPLSRPTITKALEMLEDDLAFLEIPPKPYLSSPARPVNSSSTY